MASQYNMTLYQAGWELPLRVALTMYPVAAARLGFEVSGMTWAQKAAGRARRQMRRALERLYEIETDQQHDG